MSGCPNSSAAPSSASLPLLCDKSRAQAEWGNIGTTKFYELIRAHNVSLVRIGSKTAVSGEDVARVASEMIAASNPPPIDARALAKRSVEARQARRLAKPYRGRRGDHAP